MCWNKELFFLDKLRPHLDDQAKWQPIQQSIFDAKGKMVGHSEAQQVQVGEERPLVGESGKEFAKRVMDKKYGKGKWAKRGVEYNKIKKWADRSFEDPK